MLAGPDVVEFTVNDDDELRALRILAARKGLHLRDGFNPPRGHSLGGLNPQA